MAFVGLSWQCPLSHTLSVNIGFFAFSAVWRKQG
jgi:hypothetical protein